MSNQDKDKSTTGVIESIINLGTATTKLTIDQVQNAFTAITRPGEAVEHMKETMNNLSEAMMNSTSSATKASSVSEPEPITNDLRGAPTGMEHLSADAPAAKAHTTETLKRSPINRRKS